MAWNNNRSSNTPRNYSYQRGDVVILNNTVTGFTVAVIVGIKDGLAYGQFTGFHKGRFTRNETPQVVKVCTHRPLNESEIEDVKDFIAFFAARQAKKDELALAANSAPDLGEVDEDIPLPDLFGAIAVPGGLGTATPV